MDENTIAISDILANADSSPQLSAALAQAEKLCRQAGVDLGSQKMSIPTIKATLDAKIRSRRAQLKSVRELKMGSVEENEKRTKKREKLMDEIIGFEQALLGLQDYKKS